MGPNPVDAFVEAQVSRGLEETLREVAAAPGTGLEECVVGMAPPLVFFSQRKYPAFGGGSGGGYVPIQRLAHASGLAHLSQECHMCLHPVHGPWFSLRAVITFKGVKVEKKEQQPPRISQAASGPISEEGKRRLKAQCDKAVQSCGQEGATREWIELREMASRLAGTDACWHYSQQQLQYHYSLLDREALVADIKAGAP